MDPSRYTEFDSDRYLRHEARSEMWDLAGLAEHEARVIEHVWDNFGIYGDPATLVDQSAGDAYWYHTVPKEMHPDISGNRCLLDRACSYLSSPSSSITLGRENSPVEEPDTKIMSAENSRTTDALAWNPPDCWNSAPPVAIDPQETISHCSGDPNTEDAFPSSQTTVCSPASPGLHVSSSTPNLPAGAPSLPIDRVSSSPPPPEPINNCATRTGARKHKFSPLAAPPRAEKIAKPTLRHLPYRQSSISEADDPDTTTDEDEDYVPDSPGPSPAKRRKISESDPTAPFLPPSASKLGKHVLCGLDGCKLICSNAADMRRHRESLLHSSKKYDCPGCPATFTRQDAQKRHVKLQTRCRGAGMRKLRAEFLARESVVEAQADGANHRALMKMYEDFLAGQAGPSKPRNKRNCERFSLLVLLRVRW